MFLFVSFFFEVQQIVNRQKSSNPFLPFPLLTAERWAAEQWGSWTVTGFCLR